MHDKNGKPVMIGQRITIEGEVTHTNASKEYCNVNIRITEKGQEHGPYNITNNITANTRQITVIEEPELLGEQS